MADAERHTEAWKDNPWKKFQRVVFRLQKRTCRATHMVSMTRTIRPGSRMIGDDHVRFCTGRGRGDPPPDRLLMCG